MPVPEERLRAAAAAAPPPRSDSESVVSTVCYRAASNCVIIESIHGDGPDTDPRPCRILVVT